MIDEILPLCPCPWCKEIPEVRLSFESRGQFIEGKWIILCHSWNWSISCDNFSCNVKPSVCVCVRKTSQVYRKKFFNKVCELFNKWNKDNPLRATQGKHIFFNEKDQIKKIGYVLINDEFSQKEWIKHKSLIDK